jgi:hypothetical protein
MRLMNLIVILLAFNCCKTYESQESISLPKKNNDSLLESDIRLIPFFKDSLTYFKGVPNIELFYAIDIPTDTLTKGMQISLDNFVCKLYNKKFKNRRPYVLLWFLKETEKTKMIKDEGVSDSNNPGSSEHLVLAQYLWIDNKPSHREYNENIRYSDFDCK